MHVSISFMSTQKSSYSHMKLSQHFHSVAGSDGRQKQNGGWVERGCENFCSIVMLFTSAIRSLSLVVNWKTRKINFNIFHLQHFPSTASLREKRVKCEKYPLSLREDFPWAQQLFSLTKFISDERVQKGKRKTNISTFLSEWKTFVVYSRKNKNLRIRSAWLKNWTENSHRKIWNK